MAMPTEDNERSIIDENTGLLSNASTTTISNDGSESQVLDGASSMRPVLTSLLLIYLFQAGISASVAPTTDIIEGLICRNYYRNHEGTAGHSACKAEPIQSKLAALKGMSSLLTPLPGWL